jgi:hypothetical protein
VDDRCSSREGLTDEDTRDSYAVAQGDVSRRMDILALRA